LKFDDSDNSGVDGDPETYFFDGTPKKKRANKIMSSAKKMSMNVALLQKKKSIANFIDSSDGSEGRSSDC